MSLEAKLDEAVVQVAPELGPKRPGPQSRLKACALGWHSPLGAGRQGEESRLLALPLALGTGPPLKEEPCQSAMLVPERMAERPAPQASGVGRPFRTLPSLPGLRHSVNRWPQAASVSSFSLLPAPLIVHDHSLWEAGCSVSSVPLREARRLKFSLTLLHAQAHLISSCTS